MISKPVIRVVPAVFGRGNLETLEAAVRMIDPDTGEEFFSVSSQHAEALIASIRRAVADAELRMAEIEARPLEERRLIATPAEGRA